MFLSWSARELSQQLQRPHPHLQPQVAQTVAGKGLPLSSAHWQPHSRQRRPPYTDFHWVRARANTSPYPKESLPAPLVHSSPRPCEKNQVPLQDSVPVSQEACTFPLNTWNLL